jgi:hypothetical protein
MGTTKKYTVYIILRKELTTPSSVQYYQIIQTWSLKRLVNYFCFWRPHSLT